MDAESHDVEGQSAAIQQHFSDFFEIDPNVLDEYGAFNISLINDLPVFIDPFLLFNSEKSEYQQLHDQVIDYLRFLRGKADTGITKGLLKAWYTFPEVKQNWLGYSLVGNSGSGLGPRFALALNRNLNTVFKNFGDEQITQGSHLEKLTLIDGGVGRDNISDFTTNLIKGYLLQYTDTFAKQYLRDDQRQELVISGVRFNYTTETWVSDRFTLPVFNGDFVLLTPRDILTKDDVWISRHDLYGDFRHVVSSLPNDQLRAQINNYFLSALPKKEDGKDPSAKEENEAKTAVFRRFPELIEYYIRYKEEHGDEAVRVSDLRIADTEAFFIDMVSDLAELINRSTPFYTIPGNTYEEALARVNYLKDAIEKKGCYRYFYKDGEPIRRESDLQIMYRLVWFGTPSDISREVNDGRGPADFKVSRGVADKTIVEFKLASNRQLKRNLQKQAEIYQEASDAQNALKVILYFDAVERQKVVDVLDELELADAPNIILIDARADNKPSASKA